MPSYILATKHEAGATLWILQCFFPGGNLQKENLTISKTADVFKKIIFVRYY